MAFLANLNRKDINKICLNYNLFNINEITPIYEGIQNSNYIIYDKKKYILTIYEDANVIKNLNKYIDLLIYFKKVKFNCPIPIEYKNNQFIYDYNTKKYGIFTFIKGKYLRKFSAKHLYYLGLNLSKMHMHTNNISIKISNYFNNTFYNKNIKKHKKYISSYNKYLIKKFENTIKDYVSITKLKLPTGIIHGDLFPDNVLFYKGKISGFIDFYYACNNYLISDLAIIIISWCFNYKSNKLYLNKVKVRNLFIGYNEYRNIKKVELRFLNLLCKIYCIRFFFTRINDMNKNYDPKYKQIKNPNEYLEKFLYLENSKINFRNLI